MTTTDEERLWASFSQVTAENKVLSLLHRWYAFYEREEKDLERQLEMLTDDFAIIRPKESALPSVQGKAAYRESVLAAPKGQKNAHFRRSFALTRGGGGASFVVSHEYQTEGPAMTGSAEVRYDGEVVDIESVAPRFRSLEESVSSVQTAPFREAYAHNRVEAFVHRWVSLMEGTDPEPMHELLAPVFEIQTSSASIRDWPGFVGWFQGLASQVRKTAHQLDELSVAQRGNAYDVSLEFAWHGMAKSGQPMIARTHHDWTLVETWERYPRLSSFRVRAVKPFTPVSTAEALAAYDAAAGRRAGSRAG